MNKLYVTIRSFPRRIRLAWRVFREDPDEVVRLTETEGGSVEFRNQFGFGVAGNHRAALEGIAQQYGLFLGQSGLDTPEDREDGDGR